MEKLKIVQVSGSFNGVLRTAGFVSRSGDDSLLFVGCVPPKDKEFFVYYEEPEREMDYAGSFKLVRMDGNEEVVVDEGLACGSHFHSGLNTKTFYGKGHRMSSWSFHCSPE